MEIYYFQEDVAEWLVDCFGSKIALDKQERNHRYLEESLELVQSLGCTKEEVHKLVDYVFNRPIGEPNQEVGGAMVTLAALCFSNKINLNYCATTELDRINKPEVKERIRLKQQSKPKHSPLAE